MRRRLQRRSQLVGARTRAKNEVHAVLMRQLVGRSPFTDLFGKKGRGWLAGLELAPEERESVDAAIRQIDFLDSEIAEVERLIATEAITSPEIRRLMTVPGVNVICAATFMAAIGDVTRFENPRKLVGYLGLDPKVRQSGSGPGDPWADLKAGLGECPPCAGRGELVDGPPARPDPRLLSAHQGAPGPPGRGRRRRAKARLPVLVPADARGGLRLRSAVADAAKAAPARDPRRRSEPQGHPHRQVGCWRCDARGRALRGRAGRGRLQADG